MVPLAARSGLAALPEWASVLPSRIAGIVPTKADDLDGDFDPDLVVSSQGPAEDGSIHPVRGQSRKRTTARRVIAVAGALPMVVRVAHRLLWDDPTSWLIIIISQPEPLTRCMGEVRRLKRGSRAVASRDL